MRRRFGLETARCSLCYEWMKQRNWTKVQYAFDRKYVGFNALGSFWTLFGYGNLSSSLSSEMALTTATGVRGATATVSPFVAAFWLPKIVRFSRPGP